MCNSSHGDAFQSTLSAGDDGWLGRGPGSVTGSRLCLCCSASRFIRLELGRLDICTSALRRGSDECTQSTCPRSPQLTSQRHTQVFSTLICFQLDKWPSLGFADSALRRWFSIRCQSNLHLVSYINHSVIGIVCHIFTIWLLFFSLQCNSLTAAVVQSNGSATARPWYCTTVSLITCWIEWWIKTSSCSLPLTLNWMSEFSEAFKDVRLR